MKLQHIFLTVLGAIALEACQVISGPIPPPGSEAPAGLQKITNIQRQKLQGLFTILIDHEPESCQAIGLRQQDIHEHSSAEKKECVSQNSGKEGVSDKVTLDYSSRETQIYLNSKYYVFGSYDLYSYLSEIFQEAVLKRSSDIQWLDGKQYTGHVEAYDFAQRRVTVIFYSRDINNDGLSLQLERIAIVRWRQDQARK